MYRFLFFLIFISVVLPQEITLSKEDIISKTWKTMFGDLKNEDVHSFYVETYAHGGKIPSKITIKRPHFFRNEYPYGILVYDGKKAARIESKTEQNGKKYETGILDPLVYRHFEVDIALIFPAFFEYPSEFRGIIKVNGKKVYELYVNLPGGSFISYFIDPDSFKIISRLVNWDGDKRVESWDNSVMDYVKYDGFYFPGGYTFEGRKGPDKGIYSNVKINISPDPALFKIPDTLPNIKD